MNQGCIIQRGFGISDVSNNADSELALYNTALIQNQCCIRQQWFRISAISDSADSRIFTFKYEYLREFETEFENILGCESGAHMGQFMKKKQSKKSRATVPLI